MVKKLNFSFHHRVVLEIRRYFLGGGFEMCFIYCGILSFTQAELDLGAIRGARSRIHYSSLDRTSTMCTLPT